jgi:hypothetical protein
MYSDGLFHHDLFYETIDILSKGYENPSSLTDIEKKIVPHIERLLDGRIAIQIYSETIEALKAFHKPEPSKKKIDELNTSAQKLCEEPYEEWRYHDAIDKWKVVLKLDPGNQTAKEGIKKAERRLKKKVHILVDKSHKEYIFTSEIREVLGELFGEFPGEFPGEFSEFEEQLRKWGEVTVCREKTLTVNDLEGQHILVIGGPELRWVFSRGADKWRGDEVEAIKAFVTQGGGLLVSGYNLINTEHLNVLTSNFGIYFLVEQVGDVTVVDLEKHPVTEGLQEIKPGSLDLNGGKCLQASEPTGVLARYEGWPVLVASEYGSGRVVAMASITAFSNEYLQANARLLDNILSYLLRKNKQ